MKADLTHLTPKNSAQAMLFAQWMPQPETERVPVWDCVGRVLAEDVIARYDLPVVRASTMDGVAVDSRRFADGVPDASAWKLGTDYVRADTGDDFADAFDAVIAIENVTILDQGGLAIAPDVKVTAGSNVKGRGADLKLGAVVLTAGTLLTVTDMAAAGMSGASEVTVLRKPRIGFVPSGSELVPTGSELKRGQNFDTNSPMVAAMLREMGAEPVMHPIVRDDKAALHEVVDELLPQCDILILNAGTSLGDEDYCAQVLAERGKVLFHGVAAVPGRPMSMAIVDGKPVVNLSGPAFAAFYSVDWAIRAMVCLWFGQPLPQRQRVKVKLAGPLQVPPIFSMMAALRLTREPDGTLTAVQLSTRGPNSAGGAAILTADAVYVSALGEKPHAPGEELEVELLRRL